MGFIIRNRIKELFKDGFFHILVGNVLTKMVAFLSSIIIVRLISKADYAYLAYADNLYQYINLLSGLGLSTAILKFCSPLKSKGENKFYYVFAMRVGVSFQLIVSLLFFLIICVVEIPFPQAKSIIGVLILYPALTQIVTTIQSYIRAQLQNRLYATIGVIQTIVLFLTSVPLALVFKSYGVVIARYIAMASVIIIGNKYIRKNIPKNVETIKAENSQYNLFWKISISMMLANLFSMIMPINEMFIINNYIKDEVISANYKVAILIPSQIVFITNSVVIYLFPKIAQYGRELRLALSTTVKTGVVLFSIIGLVCGLGYVLTPLIIRVVYGTRYLDAIELSQIYWVVYGVNAGFRMLPMNMLPAVGSTSFNSLVSIFSCLIHAVLLRFMIAEYGILGAPYSLLIIYIVSSLLYWGYFYSKCKIENRDV